ncbi:MAG: aspartate--ammonia ligase, partial [Deltaproteobacteria bacterium]|nr:aspartate--ammonia ligase [Deltaproteobacteria bacterium]
MYSHSIRRKVFDRAAILTPEDYKNPFDVEETELAIKYIKDLFQREFSKALGLKRVSAPPFVLRSTGLNDYLNGIERPVSFRVKSLRQTVEVVQSLAKWKRNALYEYGFGLYEGLYTDMNAIRPDEYLDNLHSVYVDQWDWEKIIRESDRNVDFLKKTVRNIYSVIQKIEEQVIREFRKGLKPILPEEIYFIHSEELYDMYPDLSPREREYRITKDKKAVFIIGIGAKLGDGNPHDGRAADYDDWSTPTSECTKGLNGDILEYYPLLDMAFELSSMGIRVNRESLIFQLRAKKETYKLKLPYHSNLLKGVLPQTIGGGIGQSRLWMFYLRKAHIG